MVGLFLCYLLSFLSPSILALLREEKFAKTFVSRDTALGEFDKYIYFFYPLLKL